MSPARTCAVLALLAAVAFAQTEPDAAVTHAAAAAAAETQGAAAVTESNEPIAVSAATAVAAATAAAPLAAAPTVAEPTAAAPTAAALTPPAVVTPPALGATLANAEATSPSPATPPAAGTAASPAAPSPGAPLAASSPSARPSTAAAAAATSPPTSTDPAFASSAPAATPTPTAASTAYSSLSADVTTSVHLGSPSPETETDATTPQDTADGTDGTDGPPEAPWPVLVTQEPRSVRAREGGNASLSCAARGPLALLRGARVSWHRRSPHGERVEHEAGRSELAQGDDADADGEDEDEVELWAQLLLLQVLESRDEGAFYCVVTSSSGDATSHGEGSTLLVSALNSGWRGLGDGVLGALGAACAGLGVLMGLLVALVPGVRDKLACGKSSSISLDHV
ncbi:uncharacterized protein LOC133347426 [Lethenteron reissneri]|uniref:uncharacterized protein LOC133347426 n=1 Tax=Lethenteron reissneri TaxID=7753 RepID=UPI002AB61FBB|nr:uncharacterized protein LOC133347426 [Lethenteron reissneri]